MTTELFPPSVETRPAFQAWRRPRSGRWKVVATGETDREATFRLLEAANQDRTGDFESIVLPTGQRP